MATINNTTQQQQPDNFKHDTGGFRISDYEANKAKQRLLNKYNKKEGK